MLFFFACPRKQSNRCRGAEQHTQGHPWKLFEPAVGSQASFFLTSIAAPIVEQSHRTNLTCFMEFLLRQLSYNINGIVH